MRAMQSYHDRQSKTQIITRKNKKPEKEVERQCMDWMRLRGWSVQVIESKATYNPEIGVYRNQSAKAGTADCIGCTNDGIFVAVEFKAKGRKSTLRPQQYKFLVEKIEHNAFAVCVESADELAHYYELWVQHSESPSDRREIFQKLLPCKRERNSSPIFE